MVPMQLDGRIDGQKTGFTAFIHGKLEKQHYFVENFSAVFMII